MSEVAEAAAPVADISAGTLLRRAREAAGLHVAALAVSLKVPVRKLEALEEDRHEDLGDAVFIRALASSVCRTLKMEPQPVLERLPQSSAPRLVKDSEGLNAPFRAPNDGTQPAWREALRQPVPLTVMALLAGAVVIYLLPNLPSLQRGEDKPAAVAAAPGPAAAPVVAGAVPTPEPPAPAASEPAPVRVPVVVSEATPAPAVDAASAGAPATANGVVVIRAKGESWIEVVDAKGVPAVRKLMAAGETAGASGALPLTVTIGRVDMTEVEVHGKKFDMRPVSKDNVARFQVK